MVYLRKFEGAVARERKPQTKDNIMTFKSNKDSIQVTFYKSLREAVDAAGLDLSYNKTLAIEEITRHEKHPNFGGALVSKDNVVYVLFHWGKKDGNVLKEFTPFSSEMHDGDLRFMALRNKSSLSFCGWFPRLNREWMNSLSVKSLGGEIELYIA